MGIYRLNIHVEEDVIYNVKVIDYIGDVCDFVQH